MGPPLHARHPSSALTRLTRSTLPHRICVDCQHFINVRIVTFALCSNIRSHVFNGACCTAFITFWNNTNLFWRFPFNRQRMHTTHRFWVVGCMWCRLLRGRRMWHIKPIMCRERSEDKFLVSEVDFAAALSGSQVCVILFFCLLLLLSKNKIMNWRLLFVRHRR